MAWCINDKHTLILPVQPGILGIDRNAMGTLLLIVIQYCITMIHPAGFSDPASFIQHRLNTGCLARIHMRHHTNTQISFLLSLIHPASSQYSGYIMDKRIRKETSVHL